MVALILVNLQSDGLVVKRPDTTTQEYIDLHQVHKRFSNCVFNF